MILVALLDGNEDIDSLVVIGNDGIRNDVGIAIAVFVIFVDKVVLVFLVVLYDEFLLSEEVTVKALLVGFLHSPLELIIRESLVAVDGNGVYLDFLLLIDVDIENYLPRIVDVVALEKVDFGVLETLPVVVATDNGLSLVNHVGIDLIALHEANLALEVFAFGFLDAVVVDVSQTGTWRKLNIQIHLVANEFLGTNLDVGEEAVLPETLGSFGYFLTRNADNLSDRKT